MLRHPDWKARWADLRFLTRSGQSIAVAKELPFTVDEIAM
jgi:hypothetical protein